MNNTNKFTDAGYSLLIAAKGLRLLAKQTPEAKQQTALIDKALKYEVKAGKIAGECIDEETAQQSHYSGKIAPREDRLQVTLEAGYTNAEKFWKGAKNDDIAAVIAGIIPAEYKQDEVTPAKRINDLLNSI